MPSGTPISPIDPTTFNVTDRPRIKRPSNLGGGGIDRTPFHDLIKSLDVHQVVELPVALAEKDAKAAENLLRESAKDLGLSISFLADLERNGAEKPKKDTSFYAWYVKGEFVARGPRKTLTA